MKYRVETMIDREALTETYFPILWVSVTRSKQDMRRFLSVLLFWSIGIIIGVLSIVLYIKKVIAIEVLIFAIFTTLIPVAVDALTMRWRNTYKQIGVQKKKYGVSVMHRTAEFFEDKFTWKNEENGEQLVISYSAITKVFETKNFLNLTDNECVYGIAKNGFCEGSIDDFRTFIQEKIREKAKNNTGDSNTVNPS